MEAQVREEFRERLEIDTLAQRYDPDKLEELLDNIVEMYCCPSADPVRRQAAADH